ncbi:hypothetical protein NN561_020208 [Cricetulus griseus]
MERPPGRIPRAPAQQPRQGAAAGPRALHPRLHAPCPEPAATHWTIPPATCCYLRTAAGRAPSHQFLPSIARSRSFRTETLTSWKSSPIASTTSLPTAQGGSRRKQEAKDAGPCTPTSHNSRPGSRPCLASKLRSNRLS